MRAGSRRAHTARSGQPVQAVRPRRPPRTRLLASLLTFGVISAASVVAVAVLRGSLQGDTARFSSPLHIYAVNRTMPGLCPASIAGLSGQRPEGPTCFLVGEGLSIRRVNDIHVEPTPDGRHEISISLLPGDRKALAAFTRTMTGRELAFVVHERVVTAPRLQAPITQGKILISGGFTRPDADRIVREFKGGR